jgi:hypothetical protein
MKKIFYALLLLAVCAAVPASAQTPPPPPPNLLLIVREDIKPGEMPAHEREAMQFVSVQRKANERLPADARDGRIAMSPVAGNENEVTYLWAYDSFADMQHRRDESEKLATGAMRADFDRLPDARLHAAQRDLLASYRSDLSYNVGKSNIAQARYMTMQTLRLKPGHENEYWTARKKILNAAFDKTGSNASLVVFQVRGGMPGPTFIIFRPLKSLADLDGAAAPNAMRTAMGSDADDWDKVSDRAIVSTETTIYAFNPRLSLVRPDFAARDNSSPAFWNPALPAAAPATAAAAPTRRNGRR